MGSKFRLVVLAAWCTLALAATGAAQAAERSDEERFIDIMSGYLDMSSQWVQMASDRQAVIFFAVEGIVEVYEERGEVRRAIPHLEGILEKYPENGAIRSIIRFKLRDLYRDTGQHEQALQQLEALIDEMC